MDWQPTTNAMQAFHHMCFIGKPELCLGVELLVLHLSPDMKATLHLIGFTEGLQEC